MTTLNVQAFIPLTGSGYLHLDDGSTSMVAFKIVVSVENMSGGGFIFGEKQFIRRAAAAWIARLEISPKKYLGLVLGIADDGTVSVAVRGMINAAPPSNKKTGG